MMEQAGPRNLLIFGFGYSGRAIAKAAVAAGFAVTATSRKPDMLAPEAGVALIAFDAAAAAIARATHVVATPAPEQRGDPVLLTYDAQIAAAKNLRWVGYLSTTGVYGNHDGGWVDEDTPPNPQAPRAIRRVAAETAWSALPVAVDIFRLAGIYGPGRSMFDELRAGTARRIVKPGHVFGRIHRDDIGLGVVAAMRQNAPPGVRTFNVSDDEPAASADVVVAAAGLLGIEPPEPLAFATAAQMMSPMALSFWADNRKVANAKTKTALNIAWKYPNYRDGLRAILLEELGEHAV